VQALFLELQLVQEKNKQNDAKDSLKKRIRILINHKSVIKITHATEKSEKVRNLVWPSKSNLFQQLLELNIRRMVHAL